MPDQSEQHLQDISTKIQEMVDLLRVTNQQTGQPSTSNVFSNQTSSSNAIGPASLMSDPNGVPDYIGMMMREQEQRNKPRKILKESAPVDIMKFSPKALEKLTEAIGDRDGPSSLSKGSKTGNFVENLLDTIGVPLLALAGGITALLASANINFGMFEGLTNMIGKQGLQGGLKMFLKPFLKFSGKAGAKMLKRVPVIGSLIGFYFAWERYQNDDYVGMALEIASALANLIPGIGTFLSIGIDIFNSWLDIQSAPGSPGEPPEPKLGILKDIAATIWESSKEWIRDVPFIGAIFHGMDAYEDLFGPKTKWGSGLTSLAQMIINMVPGLNVTIGPAISILRGMLDPAYRQKSKLGEIGGDIEGKTGFMSKIGDAIRDWVSNLLYGIADMLPEMFGIRHSFAENLKARGFKPPADFKMPDSPDVQAMKELKDLSNADLADALKDNEDTSAELYKAQWDEFNKRGLDPDKLDDIAGADWNPFKSDDAESFYLEGKAPKKKAWSGSSQIYPDGYMGPRRADGGPVNANQTYLVGERGPELFQSNVSGNITSNEDIVSLLKTNNEILHHLSMDIVNAVRETGTTMINTSNNVVNNSMAGENVRSFREQVKNSLYR